MAKISSIDPDSKDNFFDGGVGMLIPSGKKQTQPSEAVSDAQLEKELKEFREGALNQFSQSYPTEAEDSSTSQSSNLTDKEG